MNMHANCRLLINKTHPNLREVSELSSSGGGPLLQLQTLFTDSDDMPSSWIAISESTKTTLFPLHEEATCKFQESPSVAIFQNYGNPRIVVPQIK